MMSGKQKLYFLLDKIDDARAIAPSGRPIVLHGANDLNNRFTQIELAQLLAKLQTDENVLRVLKIPYEVLGDEFLDPYADLDNGGYYIEILPTFNTYFLKIQQEPEYQEFTGKKPASQSQTSKSIFGSSLFDPRFANELEIQRLYKELAEVDKQIKIRREALAKAQSSINDNPLYSEATRVGHLAKLEQQAQTDIGNFIKQKETYLTELSLRKSDTQTSESSQVHSDPQKQKANTSYDPQKGVLDIEGKKVKFKKESFRAKLLELLLKDDKSRKKEWSCDEVIETIEGITDLDLIKDKQKKFYPACDGLSKFVAQKLSINDLLIFNKSTVQINSKYL
ncbi:hypothetical protein A3F29_00950 [Candidatus Roizmanbacteria bacterium RIFCSPHIGHO2_12_FULL_33_9]|uniref:Uncharacterized protein n=1 Tax=Candidatus Roizmanbacteria bacterium RIFCSPHIGHO2_12_FULL_33_9 TaxID=1802045 RepID=A0A1F7HGK8_9BACT|nr:MAG: hypothetical protein A3F29_00950 [Candidatus Roizmanbacteria bacterium RIFCSPHIGHO2_12_FULL_33_9]